VGVKVNRLPREDVDRQRRGNVSRPRRGPTAPEFVDRRRRDAVTARPPAGRPPSRARARSPSARIPEAKRLCREEVL
jgi:hypothetical protein